MKEVSKGHYVGVFLEFVGRKLLALLSGNGGSLDGMRISRRLRFRV